MVSVTQRSHPDPDIFLSCLLPSWPHSKSSCPPRTHKRAAAVPGFTSKDHPAQEEKFDLFQLFAQRITKGPLRLGAHPSVHTWGRGEDVPGLQERDVTCGCWIHTVTSATQRVICEHCLHPLGALLGQQLIKFRVRGNTGWSMQQSLPETDWGAH